MYFRSVPLEARVAEVLSFFDDDKATEERPDLVHMYFEQPDSTGHAEGPLGDSVLLFCLFLTPCGRRAGVVPESGGIVGRTFTILLYTSSWCPDVEKALNPLDLLRTNRRLGTVYGPQITAGAGFGR